MKDEGLYLLKMTLFKKTKVDEFSEEVQTKMLLHASMSLKHWLFQSKEKTGCLYCFIWPTFYPASQFIYFFFVIYFFAIFFQNMAPKIGSITSGHWDWQDL